jgi:hypothetical protein
MTRLADEPDILDLATKLGLAAGDDPVEAILAKCRHRLDRWVEEAGGVRTIGELESLVTARLQMVFEEIRDDAGFDRIKQVYAVGKRDFVFATMRQKFDDLVNPTYGALVRRKTAAPDAPDRLVAVIDCRGDKLARRFFTRWHEIAHRLTTDADPDQPQYRSEHDPIEQLMDRIASHIGFYEPFLRPAIQEASQDSPLLTFATVQEVITRAFPTASFQATLFACARHTASPVLYIEAMRAYKKEVKRRLATPSLFGDDPPPGEVRAVKVLPNEAAKREGLFIPTNMRVPEDSVIHRLFEPEPLTDGYAQECLSQWKSQGKALPRWPVAVEGRMVADRVIALVQPLGTKAPQIDRSEPVISLFQ